MAWGKVRLWGLHAKLSLMQMVYIIRTSMDYGARGQNLGVSNENTNLQDQMNKVPHLRCTPQFDNFFNVSSFLKI